MFLAGIVTLQGWMQGWAPSEISSFSQCLSRTEPHLSSQLRDSFGRVSRVVSQAKLCGSHSAITNPRPALSGFVVRKFLWSNSAVGSLLSFSSPLLATQLTETVPCVNYGDSCPGLTVVPLQRPVPQQPVIHQCELPRDRG